MAFFLFRVIKKTPKNAMRHLRDREIRGKRNKARVRLGGILSNPGNGTQVERRLQAAGCGGGCSLQSSPERLLGLRSAGSRREMNNSSTRPTLCTSLN